MNVKNAFDYHNELTELATLVSSMKYSLEYIEGAFNHLTDDDNPMIAMALSLAKADMEKALVKLEDRHAHIVKKLSSSWF